MDREFTDKFLTKLNSPATADGGDHLATLRTAVDALIRSDFETFAELVTEDIELNISGFNPISGAWRGRSEVVAAARKNFAMLENQQPAIESIISQGNVVAVLIHESGVLNSTGQAYSVRGVQWFSFEDGN